MLARMRHLMHNLPYHWACSMFGAVLSVGAQAAMAQEASNLPLSRHWRVCLGVPVPPFVTLDAKHPGFSEKLLVESANQAGLSVEIEAYPLKRCRQRLALGQTDATMAAATANNQAELQFPMQAGEVDTNRRVTKIQLLWIKRKDSALDWDGQSLRGGDADQVVVGTRASFRAATEALMKLGLKVDDVAFDVPQLLRKLAAGRVDLAVVAKAEMQTHLPNPEREGLQVLATPFLTNNLYLALRPGQSAARQAQAEAWWDVIGRLREKAEFLPR
ncbi:transporter substrate-binding domain-containing protein [Paucibacter sp. TC2R-5]|uniref:transporter substrate-binding domain-containing protein n=1 Tax=Paucibacter sp. TC2R-5 TaxID=2893555 RepID=UPI0021E3778C|nr:transporter substrate-binding domain-containing protein [Paucibacter sp. TC2R-5]MCV2359331.1 transporter substrate-binding domain-containing protein [Paucibacter sp. TC2R-5]